MFNKVGSMVTKVTIVTVTIEGIVLHLFSFERKEENLKSSSDLCLSFFANLIFLKDLLVT